MREVFQKIEKAGGQATLSASTACGKSLRLRLQLPLHLCLLQPPRHLGVAIVAVVLERGPAAISGLLPTRLHWLRQPLVFRWKIPVLSNSIPLRHLLLGGAK